MHIARLVGPGWIPSKSIFEGMDPQIAWSSKHSVYRVCRPVFWEREPIAKDLVRPGWRVQIF